MTTKISLGDCIGEEMCSMVLRIQKHKKAHSKKNKQKIIQMLVCILDTIMYFENDEQMQLDDEQKLILANEAWDTALEH